MKTKVTKLDGCSGNEEIVHKLAHGSIEMSNLYKYIYKLLKERNINKIVEVTINLLDEEEQIEEVLDDFDIDEDDDDILTDKGSDESE